MGNVIPIDRPRVVPGGVEQHPVAITAVCTAMAACVVVPWWLGLWTIVRWVLR